MSRIERATSQDKRRQETRMKEIESRQKRVQELYEKQMCTIIAAAEHAQARRKKRLLQINES